MSRHSHHDLEAKREDLRSRVAGIMETLKVSWEQLLPSGKAKAAAIEQLTKAQEHAFEAIRNNLIAP